MHSENPRKEFMHPWRRRKETLGVFSLYAKRYKSVYISVNNNTNLNLFKILSNYIIWDRLSQKTISRYCPFNNSARSHPQTYHQFLGFFFLYLIYACFLTISLFIFHSSVQACPQSSPSAQYPGFQN
jgi:hypothetical protein